MVSLVIHNVFNMLLVQPLKVSSSHTLPDVACIAVACVIESRRRARMFEVLW